MAPTTTVIDAGKDLPDNHTPTFAKEPKKMLPSPAGKKSILKVLFCSGDGEP